MNIKLFSRYREGAVLFFIVVLGIVIFYPTHDVQLHLAQGDHGNNLCAFERTMEGAAPYRDYWWVYGPLMPYVYALVFKIFGVSIHSALLGYTFISFLCGIVIYRTMRVFFSVAIAFAATVFFWVYPTPFEHTFNHVAGILAINSLVYALFLYVRYFKIRFLYGGLISAIVLSLIKLNFGLAMLAGLVLSVLLIDLFGKVLLSAEKKRFYLVSCVAAPAMIAAVYSLFIFGLPWYVVRQCLLFLDTDPNHATIGESLKILWSYYLPQLWRQNIVGFWAVIGLCAAYSAFLWVRHQFEKSLRKNLMLISIPVVVLTLVGLHEFLVSGVTYRMFWVEPFRILVIFIVIGAAVSHTPRPVRWGVCIVIIAMSLNGHWIRTRYLGIVRNYIPLDRAKVYTTNQDAWLKTVAQTVFFLRTELMPGESFLALPSEQLYYFLLDRDSPTRDTELGLRLVPEQEEGIIRAMEAQGINYILMSNRFRMPETGFRAFGEDYGRVLAYYIRKNFTPIAKFGDWEKNPGWIGNHGVVILKRNGSSEVLPEDPVMPPHS